MKKIAFILSVLFVAFLAACKSSATTEKLYGKWNYTRVRHPNAGPADSLNSVTLQIEKPSIEFTNKDSLIIHWDGRILSHGTFRLDGRNIQYTEILADGQTREFPFYIEDFNDKQLIFSTKGKDGSEVTAVKQ